MINPSNALSLLRLPLSFLFLIDSIAIRITAVILAMLTDVIDGYLARRFQFTSRFGAILDPLMDKFFVYFSLTILFLEARLLPWQFAALLSRDFFLILFGIYLLFARLFKTYRFGSILWGKISTACQFAVLIALIIGFPIPSITYALFILFGALAFVELFRGSKEAA